MKNNFYIFWVIVFSIFISCSEPNTIDFIINQNTSPDVSIIKVYFKTGSSSDNENKKGLNYLTTTLMAASRTETLSYETIQEFLFRTAAKIEVTSDKEVTVFTGIVTTNHFDEFVPIFLSKIFNPQFTEDGLQKIRDVNSDYLKNQLPNRDDEYLSKLGLEFIMYNHSSYQYPSEGKIQDLSNISLGDITSQHNKLININNFSIGLSGKIDRDSQQYISDLINQYELSKSNINSKPILTPQSNNNQFLFIENQSNAVSISIGLPINLTRANPDFYALLVANSFLGEHRVLHGQLTNEIRIKRGLNYGAYSYIEHWMEDSGDPPYPVFHVVRNQNYFSIWLRTMERKNVPFILKTALTTFNRWIENGLTEEEFELSRSYIKNYSKLWIQTPERQLANLMDSRYFGINNYITSIDSNLTTLTVDQVNQTIKKYFQNKPLYFSIVGADSDQLRENIFSTDPTLPNYTDSLTMSAELKKKDSEIGQLQIGKGSITVIQADRLFE